MIEVGRDDADRWRSAIATIPPDWAAAIGPAASPEALAPIAGFVAAQPNTLPEPDLLYAALRATPFASVRAVILGQDPYPNGSHAMGLAFSVPRDLRPLPRSLRNIHAELRTDLGIEAPDHGSLEAWTRHGVLLLNTSLTVHEGNPASHRRARWRMLTDAIIKVVAARDQPAAFLLWGVPAKAKARFVDGERHVIVPSSHPSPLSEKGFLGTKPFSRANDGLRARGADAIEWGLDD